jgi:hypothetical protein
LEGDDAGRPIAITRNYRGVHMLKSLTNRVTPLAVVVACGVLLASGTASYAAFTVGTKQIRNGAVKRAKIHRRAVTSDKLANRAVVARTIAHRAIKTNSIANGAVTANKLAAGAVTPLAYANVAPGASPTFVSGTTSGFTAVSRPSTGTYCLTPSADADPATGVLVASPDATHSTGLGTLLSVVVEAVAGAPDCSAGSFEVQTKVLASAAGVLTSSDAVGFTVIAT